MFIVRQGCFEWFLSNGNYVSINLVDGFKIEGNDEFYYNDVVSLSVYDTNGENITHKYSSEENNGSTWVKSSEVLNFINSVGKEVIMSPVFNTQDSAKKTRLLSENRCDLSDSDKFLGKYIQLRADDKVTLSSKARLRKVVSALNEMFSGYDSTITSESPSKLFFRLDDTEFSILLTISKATVFYNENKQEIHSMLKQVGVIDIYVSLLSEDEVSNINEESNKLQSSYLLSLRKNILTNARGV